MVIPVCKDYAAHEQRTFFCFLLYTYVSFIIDVSFTYCIRTKNLATASLSVKKNTCTCILASFPGSPSFHAIIPCMTFDPPEGKSEGEAGRFCHMTSVMLHPYIRYRRGQTGLLFHGSSSATWDLEGSLAVVALHAYAV